MIDRLLRRVRGKKAPASTPRRSFSYEEAVALLAGRGVDESIITLGSVSEGSFASVAEAVARHGPARPLRALHIGNFLGLSLAALSDIVVRHDSRSVIVSVDPNLRHHGIDDPQSHVMALLDHFGLQGNNVVICAYSMQRVENRTHVGTFADQPAGEHALANLERLGQRFDIAMVDGNHDANYVRGELETLARILDEGALLVLDDVANDHTQLPALFEEVVADGSWPFEEAGRDGRLGILRRMA